MLFNLYIGNHWYIDTFSALLSVHAFLFVKCYKEKWVVREPAAKKLTQHSKELHLWCWISQAKGPACQMNEALFSQLGGCWQMDKQVKGCLSNIAIFHFDFTWVHLILLGGYTTPSIPILLHIFCKVFKLGLKAESRMLLGVNLWAVGV